MTFFDDMEYKSEIYDHLHQPGIVLVGAQVARRGEHMSDTYYYVTADRDGARRYIYLDYATANRAALSLSQKFPAMRFIVKTNVPIEYYENGEITYPPRWHANVDDQIEAIVGEVST